MITSISDNFNIDSYGTVYFTETEICDLLYENPKIDLSDVQLSNPEKFNSSNRKTYAGLPQLNKYQPIEKTIDLFDQNNQNQWFLPQKYQDFDIKQWLLDRCSTIEQTDRVELEYSLFEQTNLINLIKYLKYLVDVMTEKKIVWGVGRGSSTASYILYLLGLHLIDPIQHQIPIEEFFKQGKENGQTI